MYMNTACTHTPQKNLNMKFLNYITYTQTQFMSNGRDCSDCSLLDFHIG